MNRGNRPELMWGLGLTQDTARLIQQAAGTGFFLRNYEIDALPGRKDLDQEEQPCVAWIAETAWNGLSSDIRQSLREQENTQRILIKPGSSQDVVLADILEQGFLTVITGHVSEAKVLDALFRAKELAGLYTDLYRMTEEIILDRELLSRKTDQLMFLNKVMAGATESLDVSEILASARDNLNMLLPVRVVHAAYFNPDAQGDARGVDLFLSKGLTRAHERSWSDLLLEHVARMDGPSETSRTRYVDGTRTAKASLSPRGGKLVVLPLTAGRDHFGCLALVADPDARLGKDQVQTLHSAVSHLGLALRNAMLFQAMKRRASRDGLTRIHNRQSFEEKLVLELRRQQRYRHDLSLLMLDLDHFKNINDTYGHLAGDMVLREVGDILTTMLRSSDVAARYGGEEFAVLLPHTCEVDAWRLAERIRERIEAKVFEYEDQEFTVTASIGVSSASTSTLARERELVVNADEALYRAKRGGRNMVVSSGNAALETMRQ